MDLPFHDFVIILARLYISTLFNLFVVITNAAFVFLRLLILPDIIMVNYYRFPLSENTFNIL